MSPRVEAVVFDYGHTLARYELGTWDSRLRQGLERVHTAFAEIDGLPPLDEFTDYSLHVPSPSSPRVQEAHLLCGHMLVELVEDLLIQQWNLDSSERRDAAAPGVA